MAGTEGAVEVERGTAKGDVTVIEPTRAQQTVARRMAESKATVPNVTLTADVAMDACVARRGELRASDPDTAPAYDDFVVKAAALALRDHPRANAGYRDSRFELYSRVNIGVAVAEHGALYVPTIFDADAKPLDVIARESRELAEKVRAGTITAAELGGGTFTVLGLGAFGVTEVGAIINAPQAAILSFGEVAHQPVVRDGAVVPGYVLRLTLTCDHRILYGADAASFLARIRTLLEQPGELLG